MKQIILLAAAFSALCTQAQTLVKVWETAPVVATPESVLPDTQNGILYISLIDGGPWEKDGRGGVARLQADGTGYDSTWVTGLNAPKGMGLYNNRLYVADMDEVVVVDAKTGKVEKHIPVEGAVNLNDITVSGKGIVYVSDSKTAKVFRLENDQATLFLEDMQGVNGLKSVGEDLWIASGKSFVRADQAKGITKMAELPQGGDGVEPLGDGAFLVSAWSGYIFHVKPDGTVRTLLETHADKKNTADIGYDPAKRMVYVPTFFARTVSAYRLSDQ